MPLVNCPTCRKQIEWSESKHRPFCSEKCKLLDLGEWIEEGYRVPDESSSLSKEDLLKIEESFNPSEKDEHS